MTRNAALFNIHWNLSHMHPKDRLTDEGGELREVVLGLRWHCHEGDAAGGGAANLDAQCVLFDERGCVLEVVHPARPANANGSVMHTGDSRTGASTWDDERIFVFLDALPDLVCGLEFVVVSADGHALAEVPGACAHVSDRITEREWIRLDLAALGEHREHRVATLRRSAAGWELLSNGDAVRA
ncbi:MAG: TerD family protein [Betaproteobacteria bacterium]